MREFHSMKILANFCMTTKTMILVTHMMIDKLIGT